MKHTFDRPIVKFDYKFKKYFFFSRPKHCAHCNNGGTAERERGGEEKGTFQATTATANSSLESPEAAPKRCDHHSEEKLLNFS